MQCCESRPPGAWCVEVGRRTPPVDPERASRILVQVLELAEALPFLLGAEMQFPPLAERLADGEPSGMSELVDKLFAVHDALKEKGPAACLRRGDSAGLIASKSHGGRATSTSTSSVDAADAGSGAGSVALRGEGRAPMTSRGSSGMGRPVFSGMASPIFGFEDILPLHEEVSNCDRLGADSEGRDAPVLDCASLVVF